MRRQRFQLDLSGYYDGSQASVSKLIFQDKFPIVTRRLKTKTLIPKLEALRDKRQKEGLTRYFIRHQKTTTTETAKFLRNYEVWSMMTMLNNASGLSDLQCTQLYVRLQKDPVGRATPNYHDSVLYTANQTVQVAPPAPSAAGAPASRRSPRIAASSMNDINKNLHYNTIICD